MVKYQGNKRAYADAIIGIVRQHGNPSWDLWDLCCGSGEISAYWHKPNYMVDSGPWGLFWMNLCELRRLGVPHLRELAHDFVSTPRDYRVLVLNATRKPVPTEPAEYCLTFLALQREAFNGKPIDIENGFFKSPGYGREFAYHKWIRAWYRACRVSIARAFHRDVNTDLGYIDKCNVYLDPDYEETTGYNGRKVSVESVYENTLGSHLFVSHHTVLEGLEWDRVLNITGKKRTVHCKDHTELVHVRKAKINA